MAPHNKPAISFTLLFLVLVLLRTVRSQSAVSSPGCGTTHERIGESVSRTFEASDSAGGDRRYVIRLPSNYESDDPRPLMIAYHGAGDSPENFEETTQLASEDVNPDMIVVFPEGIDGYWQGPTYADPDVSDKVFTTELVDRIKDNYCVDESRVYAVGKSNGGGFAGTLACSPDHGGQFAAFAAVAATLYTDVEGDEHCSLSRSPLPMLEVHGDEDENAPYYEATDGNGGPLPAIPEWVDRWGVRNDCSGDGPTTTEENELGEDVEDELWTCDGQEGMLRHIKMGGHGHSYPGPNDDQVYITPVIIEWLNQWQKP